MIFTANLSAGLAVFFWLDFCLLEDMTLYRSFKDLEKIDIELAHKFKQKDDAIRWCMAIEGPVSNWVKNQKRGEGGKSLYEIVWFASVRKGFFDENLPRNKRAEILTKFCPDAFRTPENAMSYEPVKAAESLQTSMEHCKYIENIKNFALQPDSSLLRIYVSEIEALIDGQQLPTPPEPQLPTIEERVEAYLRHDVVAQEKESFYQSVDVHKSFGDGIVPGLSVSQYVSKRFYDEDKPSHVDAYEFHHAKLSTDELYAYYGKYESKRHIKLYVVSPIAFDREVIKLAEKKYIGLVLINVNEGMTDNSYIVQRSIEDYAQWQLNMKVLTGQCTMNSTLMIYDGESCNLTTSLADSLVSDGFNVAPECIIKAPHLSNAYIESQADKLSRKQVDALVEERFPFLTNPLIKDFGKYAANIITLEVDPAIAAQDLGVEYEYRELESDMQLGYLDIDKETIFLKPFGDNYPRDRFTFAHELGHYLLHLSFFKQYCYSSVGETANTITQDATMSQLKLSWFEHHANYFAACFLMPRKLVYLLYTYLHNMYVKEKYGDPLGPLYYNPNQSETYESFKNVVIRLAELLCVSSQAMTYRLREMGLLKMPPES